MERNACRSKIWFPKESLEVAGQLWGSVMKEVARGWRSGGKSRHQHKQIIANVSQSVHGLYKYKPQGNPASDSCWRNALEGGGGTGGVVAGFPKGEMSAISMRNIKPHELID